MLGQKHIILKQAFRWCEYGTDDEVLCANVVHIHSCFIDEFYSQSDLIIKMISGVCVYMNVNDLWYFAVWSLGHG